MSNTCFDHIVFRLSHSYELIIMVFHYLLQKLDLRISERPPLSSISKNSSWGLRNVQKVYRKLFRPIMGQSNNCWPLYYWISVVDRETFLPAAQSHFSLVTSGRLARDHGIKPSFFFQKLVIMLYWFEKYSCFLKWTPWVFFYAGKSGKYVSQYLSATLYSSI